MQTYNKNMWCNYQKTWSKSWCYNVDKRLTSGWKQPVHLIIENTAVVSYFRLWQNEVTFHTHSVYDPFLDSGMQWLTPTWLEQFVQHWHSVITYSDNKKACLKTYSDLEMIVQIPNKSSSRVLKRMSNALESERVNLSMGGRNLIQWSDSMPRGWNDAVESGHSFWIMQKTWFITLPWQRSLMQV